MSFFFLQQQTAWGLMRFFLFPGTKSVLRVDAPRKEGRKEGKKKERKKQDSHQKQTTTTISKQKKINKIRRVFQVSNYSPQQTRPQLTNFLPSFLPSFPLTVPPFFFPG
jgi:DNA/RNA-binding domain of Phe-tRNA-synthetase-like protein